MKKSILRNIKYIMPTCIGLASILLLGFSACDFQPSKTLADERPVGGRLAQGRPELEEYIESSTGGGSGGATIDTIQSGDLALPLLTKKEIKDMLDKTDPKNLPSNPTEWYKTLPNYNAPYSAGELKQEYLDITLERLNALRRISGLHPVALDPEATAKAQAGAALMVVTQNFGHGTQPVPAGIDANNEFYKKGKDGTATGNVYPQYPLIQSIDGYNLDPGNPEVGHRLWQLNPNLKAVGIGSAIKKKDSSGKDVGLGGNVEVVIYTKVPNDKIIPEIGDWNFISWPSAGYFPLEGNLFGNPSFWHVQFNGNKYTVGSGKVIVTRLDTGEQWIEEHTGGTVIFNKSNKWRAEVGRYTFEVTGVRDKNSIPVRFVFTTEFFNRSAME